MIVYEMKYPCNKVIVDKHLFIELPVMANNNLTQKNSSTAKRDKNNYKYSYSFVEYIIMTFTFKKIELMKYNIFCRYQPYVFTNVRSEYVFFKNEIAPVMVLSLNR